MSKVVKVAGKDQKEHSTAEALFLSGSLALDLVNTEQIVRRKKVDILSSPAALAQWWDEARRQHPDNDIVKEQKEPLLWNEELLNAVKSFRAALRTISTHVVERQAVEEEDLIPINNILALGYSSLERTSQGNVQSIIRLRDAQKGSVLFPIALSAAQLFTESDWQRLHKCKNERCILFFYDTTKSGTRQWCSLGCMNRSRSIRHYQISKHDTSSPNS